MSKDLSVVTIKGKDYNMADKKSRQLIDGLLKTTKAENELIGILRQGLIDLTNTVKNQTLKRTNLSVDAVNTFPILRFTTDFSILVDISLVVENNLYSSQQVLKCYNGKVYRNTISNNYDIDCYCQKDQEGALYLFFDSNIKQYDLRLNIISYDGDSPKILLDDQRFSIDRYPKCIKLN